MWCPIIFITNPIDVRVNLPFRIGYHFLFRKATSEEIPAIKHYITPSFSGGIMNQNPYEQKYTFENESKTIGKLTDLPRIDWRYFVFELQNIDGMNLLNESPVDTLRIASDLTKAELKFDIELFQPRIAKIKHNSLHKSTNQLKHEMFDHYSYTKSDLEDLTTIYKTVGKYYRSNEFISEALTFYHLLQDTPDILNFINLNYFSILEMLVTKRPNEKQPSISAQLKYKTQKILDLEIFDLDFDDSFTVSSEINIWNKLYEYRSCLAHGSQANFRKKLKKLNSEKTVNHYLKGLLKKLFRCYLFNYSNAYVIKNDLNFA